MIFRVLKCWSRGGLMISALESGLSDPEAGHKHRPDGELGLSADLTLTLLQYSTVQTAREITM